MQLKKVLPANLLNIASKNNLQSVKIHVLNKKRFSLSNINNKKLSAFSNKARRLNLNIHIKTSASNKASINKAVAIALKTGASSVRFYPRYKSNLRDVLSIIANNIAYVQKTYQNSSLTFTIKQHKNLKSHKLVSLVKKSKIKSLSLLFNFANIINANKHPINALKTIAPHITQVHIKNALIVKKQSSLGHKACISGQKNMPFKALLTHLICLGDNKPQVTAYSLKKKVNYYAPAFRFKNKNNNP